MRPAEQPSTDEPRIPAVPSDGVPIAEAARRNGVTIHTLRYYESSGMMPAPTPRTSGGTRRYGAAELEWIHTVTRLRALGMPTNQIRRYVALVQAGPGNETDRLRLLEDHRDRVIAQLASLTANLEMINGKITTYRERVAEGAADTLWSTPRER